MLRPSADARPADWVIAGVRNFDGTVGSVVPATFAAYARVFHPASRGSGENAVEVRWADVAAANGRVMHPTAEWGSLTGSWQSLDQPGIWDEPPRVGQLPYPVAMRLARVLADHTERSRQCCFAVWDGWGIPEPIFAFPRRTSQEDQRRAQQLAQAELDSWRELIERAARFALPHRDMRLLRGSLAGIGDFYALDRSPPSLWWPEDRSWCVGTDVDLMTTYVGGSSACIGQVLAEQQLEALAVTVDQHVTWDADTVNPLPAPP